MQQISEESCNKDISANIQNKTNNSAGVKCTKVDYLSVEWWSLFAGLRCICTPSRAHFSVGWRTAGSPGEPRLEAELEAASFTSLGGGFQILSTRCAQLHEGREVEVRDFWWDSAVWRTLRRVPSWKSSKKKRNKIERLLTFPKILGILSLRHFFLNAQTSVFRPKRRQFQQISQWLSLRSGMRTSLRAPCLETTEAKVHGNRDGLEAGPIGAVESVERRDFKKSIPPMAVRFGFPL